MAYPDGHIGEWIATDEPGGEFVSNSRPLTPEELATLRAELDQDPAGRGYASGVESGADRNEVLVSLLNGTYQSPNPNPPTKVPKPMDLATLIGLLPPAAIQAFASSLGQIRQDVREGQRDDVLGWVALADRVGALTASDKSALVKELTEEVDDPLWPTTIESPPRSSLIFDEPLTLEVDDVIKAEALP